MRILIACEESQTLTKAFRARGHEAYSCDLLPCSGGHPEWHIQDDVLNHLDDGWDLMIAHPECTMLSGSGAQWYYHPEDKHLPKEKRRPHPYYPDRARDREIAVDFFMALANAKIPRIAIENPVGIMSTRWRKPDQTVEMEWFGEPHSKRTCLWLKNLPLLTPTNIVERGPRIILSSGRSLPAWYDAAKGKKPAERRKIRSKTFMGFAEAIAEQWGALP